MLADSAHRAQSWGRYWAAGRRHSCPASFEGHYGSATQAFWRDCFAGLGAEDCVLELGCGNGSLVRYLLESRGQLPCAYEAVDLAPLDSRWVQALPPSARQQLRVHAQTDAADLPLGPASITRLYAQFALEYFAGPPVWAELSRVLAPGAGICLVLHHQDSVLAKGAQAESAHCAWLLGEGGPLDQAEAILPHLWQRTARPQDPPGPEAQSARARFNRSFAQLEQRASTEPTPDVLHESARQVMAILGQLESSGMARAQGQLSALRQSLRDNQLRVEELCQAALDEASLKDWEQSLGAIGVHNVIRGEIHENGHLFGWTLSGSRI